MVVEGVEEVDFRPPSWSAATAIAVMVAERRDVNVGVVIPLLDEAREEVTMVAVERATEVIAVVAMGMACSIMGLRGSGRSPGGGYIRTLYL